MRQGKNWGETANFVVTVRDITDLLRREQEREAAHSAQRNALVREVHHRIKNNLQGVTGLLGQFGIAHPDLKPLINQAITQVLSVATIHGLQGRSGSGQLNVRELVDSIAQQIRQIWGIEVALQYSEGFSHWTINATEAVPIALILNELLSNAAKHADLQRPELTLTGLFVPGRQCLEIGISNRLPIEALPHGDAQSGMGLQLVTSLLPREGATLRTQRKGDSFESLLQLAGPVVSEQSLH